MYNRVKKEEYVIKEKGRILEKWEQLFLFDDDDPDIMGSGQLKFNFDESDQAENVVAELPEKKPEIIKADSVIQAAELAVMKKLAIKADFSQLTNLTVVNTALQELTCFYDSFPKIEVLNFLGSVRAYNSYLLINQNGKYETVKFPKNNIMLLCYKIHNNCWDYDYKLPYDFSIVLNEHLLNGYFNKVENNNFHPTDCNNPRGYFAHELGHYLGMQLNAVKDKKIKNTFRRLRKLKAVESEVSKYANTNTHEFIAECYSEYICSSNPRRVACEVSSRLIELYTEIYGK